MALADKQPWTPDGEQQTSDGPGGERGEGTELDLGEPIAKEGGIEERRGPQEAHEQPETHPDQATAA